MNALNVIKKVKLLPVIEAPDADVSEKLAAARLSICAVLCAVGQHGVQRERRQHDLQYVFLAVIYAEKILRQA